MPVLIRTSPCVVSTRYRLETHRDIWMSCPRDTASCRPSPALMMSAFCGCFSLATGIHLVTHRKQVGVEAEALAQLGEIQVEVPRQIIDDAAGPATLMVRHVVAQVLCALGSGNKARRFEHLLSRTDVIGNDVLKHQIDTSVVGYLPVVANVSAQHPFDP